MNKQSLLLMFFEGMGGSVPSLLLFLVLLIPKFISKSYKKKEIHQHDLVLIGSFCAVQIALFAMAYSRIDEDRYAQSLMYGYVIFTIAFVFSYSIWVFFRDRYIHNPKFLTLTEIFPVAANECVFLQPYGKNAVKKFQSDFIQNPKPETIKDLVEEVKLQTLKDMYGDRKSLIEFGEYLISTNRKRAAKKLSSLALSIASLPDQVMIEQIKNEFQITDWPSSTKSFSRWGK